MIRLEIPQLQGVIHQLVKQLEIGDADQGEVELSTAVTAIQQIEHECRTKVASVFETVVRINSIMLQLQPYLEGKPPRLFPSTLIQYSSTGNILFPSLSNEEILILQSGCDSTEELQVLFSYFEKLLAFHHSLAVHGYFLKNRKTKYMRIVQEMISKYEEVQKHLGNPQKAPIFLGQITGLIAKYEKEFMDTAQHSLPQEIQPVYTPKFSDSFINTLGTIEIMRLAWNYLKEQILQEKLDRSLLNIIVKNLGIKPKYRKEISSSDATPLGLISFLATSFDFDRLAFIPRIWEFYKDDVEAKKILQVMEILLQVLFGSAPNMFEFS